MSESDPHTVLGLKPGATKQQINHAFHKLAKEHHPDKAASNPNATANFQKIHSAYKKLLDAEDGLKTPPKAAPASAPVTSIIIKKALQIQTYNRLLFTAYRKYILQYLFNYKQYIIIHFNLIQDENLLMIAKTVGITDIKNVNDTYKLGSITKELYDFEVLKVRRDQLKDFTIKIDDYLQLKRKYGELPDDIKQDIASNYEFFYKKYYEQWIEKLEEFVKTQKQKQMTDSTAVPAFPIADLEYVIKEKSPVYFDVDFEDQKQMIAKIENNLLKDDKFKEWLDAKYPNSRPSQQNGSGPAADGKRSVNYKIQHTTRRPLRRKSGTKRLRRRRSNRHSRTSRK